MNDKPKSHNFGAIIKSKNSDQNDGLPSKIPDSIKKSIPKDVPTTMLSEAEKKSKKHGFNNRNETASQKGRSRVKSPYTDQLNMRVKPETRDYMLNEASETGVVLGKLLEDAIELYKNKK